MPRFPRFAIFHLQIFKSPHLQILFLLLFPLATSAQHQSALDWLINTRSLEGKHAIGEHPRGLIRASEVPALRQRVQAEPFRGMFRKLQQQTETLAKEIATAPAFQAADVANLAAHQSYLFLLTGQEEWAQQAYRHLTTVFQDTVIFQNPVSRGLTRAAMLQKMAFAYDFCYPAWNQQQRDEVNRQLYKIAYATQANMGYDANYSLVSNWMGVRWGSSLLASLVWDNPTPGRPSLADPLIWDASKRLADHLDASIFANGWNAESIGYHQYDWSFIGPALIALQNRQNGQAGSALRQMAPQALNTLWGQMTSAVAIETTAGNIGMKPDLSDDNLNLGSGLLGMSLRLYPPEQLPALKWMHDYLGESTLYSILYYPTEVPAVNPRELGWRSYADPQQGVVVLRNRFQDADDIVASFNVSATRVKGHQGPDVNTFRIIGFGAPLVVGAGRTGLVAGQTNLFPGPVTPQDKGNSSAGTFLGYETSPDGSGRACGRGSSTGVQAHTRCFSADYSGESGAAAVFVVADSSQNGRVWRLNTPEFNTIKTDKSGFTITTPDGATLRGHVLREKQPLTLRTGQVTYGGETVRLNPGIGYRGKSYKHTKWVDVETDGEITVVLTLQPKGQKHPRVEAGAKANTVVVGGREMTLAGSPPTP
jgi:hypothetical protein